MAQLLSSNITGNLIVSQNTTVSSGNLIVGGVNVLPTINSYANTIRVSANSGSTLSNKQLNFINTASVTVSVTDGGNGNANISFQSISGGSGTVTSVATGLGLTGGPITSTGTISANLASTTVQGISKLIDVVNSTDTANAATANSVKTAYDQANNAYTQANNAYTQANNAYTQANNAYGQANNAYTQANNAYGQANSAYGQANSGYTQANNAYTQANNAYGQANSGYTQANTSGNTVRVSANSGSTLSNKQLNFVNTSTVSVVITDSGSGNANIAFTSTGGSGLTTFPVSSNTGSTVTANGINFSNSDTIRVSVTSGVTGNANVQFNSTGSFGNSVSILNPDGNVKINISGSVREWAYTGRRFDTALGTGIGSAQSFYIKPDGTKFWLLDSGSATDNVAQFTMSESWNVATASLQTTINLNATSIDTLPQGIWFSNTGSSLYVLADQKNNVAQVNLSTAWDIGSTLTNPANVSISAQTSSPTGFCFSYTGNNMYVVSASEVVYQYTLSTPWDISTATYANKSFNATTYNTSMGQMSINKDGTSLLMIGNNLMDYVYEFTLTTPYDVSTAVFRARMAPWLAGSTSESTHTYVFVDYDNKTAYTGGSQDDILREWSTTGGVTLEANSISTTSRMLVDGPLYSGSLAVEGNALVQNNFTVTGSGTHTFTGVVSTSTMATSTYLIGASAGSSANTTASMNGAVGTTTVQFFSQATLSACTKTINFGTNGLAGSNTTINIGSSLGNGGLNVFSNVVNVSAETINIGSASLLSSGFNLHDKINTASNTVRVSANSGSTLSNKQINFVNTANVTILVSDSGDGNANVAFSVPTSTTSVIGITKLVDAINSTDTANAATANSVKTAYDQATNAYGQANSAYTQANNAYGQANNAYGQANSAYTQANNAYTQANNAYSAANSAANTVQVSANTGSTQTKVGLNFTNTASVIANVAAGTAGNANISFVVVAGTTSIPGIVQLNDTTTSTSTTQAGTANSVKIAYDQATNAYGQANNAYTQANNAYTQANNSYSAANSAANTVQVSANTGSTQTKVGLNFSNTTTINVSVGAGTSGNANVAFSVNVSKVIFVGTTAPASPSVGDLWVDTN